MAFGYATKALQYHSPVTYGGFRCLKHWHMTTVANHYQSNAAISEIVNAVLIHSEINVVKLNLYTETYMYIDE